MSLDNVFTHGIRTRGTTVVTRVVPLAHGARRTDARRPPIQSHGSFSLTTAAAVTGFLSGQSLLISPCSFIVQSSVTTKHRVSLPYNTVLSFFLSFLLFFFFLLPQFYPPASRRRIYTSSRERILLVKSRGGRRSKSISGYICRWPVVVN